MSIINMETKARTKDIVDALLANDDYIERLGSVFEYQKYHQRYGVSFDSYLRQQASGTWMMP